MDIINDVHKEDKKSTLWIRVRSAAILTVISIVFICAGDIYLFLINLLLAGIGVFEFSRMVNAQKTALCITAYIGTILLFIIACFDPLKQLPDLLPALIILYLLVILTLFVVKYPKYSVDQILVTFSSLIYIAFGLSFIYQTRMNLEGGAYIVWLIFICSWLSDSGAYLVGISTGKHQAFPVLSPKKSIEGCIGGVLTSVIIGCLYRLVLQKAFGIDFLNYGEICIICAAGSVISQVGDLAASAFKRQFKIKDYGRLIPGHGGVMDRYDSVIFVAPLVYYLAKMFL